MESIGDFWCCCFVHRELGIDQKKSVQLFVQSEFTRENHFAIEASNVPPRNFEKGV